MIFRAERKRQPRGLFVGIQLGEEASQSSGAAVNENFDTPPQKMAIIRFTAVTARQRRRTHSEENYAAR
jgi:hypothetical protein